MPNNLKCFAARWDTDEEGKTPCTGEVRPGARCEFTETPGEGYCEYHRAKHGGGTIARRSEGYKSLQGRPLPLAKDASFYGEGQDDL
jgi:hypothetical protein